MDLIWLKRAYANGRQIEFKKLLLNERNEIIDWINLLMKSIMNEVNEATSSAGAAQPVIKKDKIYLFYGGVAQRTSLLFPSSSTINNHHSTQTKKVWFCWLVWLIDESWLKRRREDCSLRKSQPHKFNPFINHQFQSVEWNWWNEWWICWLLKKWKSILTVQLRINYVWKVLSHVYVNYILY